MEELYSVGERLGHESSGMPGMPGMGGPGMPPGMPGADALAELLAGGGDIEQYLQSYEQMLSEGFNQEPQLNQVDAEGGITVRPDAGFVVKTRDVNSGMKVFINITSNEHIEAPHVQSLADMEGEEGVRVPLSLGTPVEDFDKKNEPCVTYDLVANPETVQECSKTPGFRETVVNLCLASVGQKYKVELDQKYKLPKMKYKGNVVQLQRIRKKVNSQIQEVDSAPVPGGKKEERHSHNRSDNGLEPPDFCVFYSLPDAGHLDGFSANWGPLFEDHDQSSRSPHMSALDLPLYRINAWKENIRGTMKNQAQRDSDKPEDQAGVTAEVQTQELLADRKCVVQVRMPQLDRQTATLKQFRVEVSDECLRVSYPPLPKSAKSVYGTLTVWWPLPFYSAQATADWDPETDTLEVSLPAHLPESAAGGNFDMELLDAVF